MKWNPDTGVFEPSAELIYGDTLTTLKALPSASVDMGVTSPPYNKGGTAGWLVKDVEYLGVPDKMSEERYQRSQVNVLNELFRIIKPGGSFFYNHKLRWDKGNMIHPMDWLRETDWTVRQEIVWDRSIAANIRGWRFWQTEERIYWLYKPVDGKKTGKELLSKHALLTSVWRFTPERDNDHPAPFPLTLPYRAIYSIMDETAGTVIDPYVGSGTTGVAAKLLGHDFIGIDACEKYLHDTEERMDNLSSKDLKTARKERELHKVNKTYKDRKNEKSWDKSKYAGVSKD